MSDQPNCELCGAEAARELYIARDRLGNSKAEFRIARCLGCGVLRTLPQMTERELAPFYPDDYWGDEEPSSDWIRSSQADKTRFVEACNLAGGRILDVGCGAGFFLRALDQQKWDRYGVEPGRRSALVAARALGQNRVFAGALKEASHEDSFFDVVAFWSSLEHTNEPRAHLIEARRILKTGGTLIIQVPNAASYQADSTTQSPDLSLDRSARPRSFRPTPAMDRAAGCDRADPISARVHTFTRCRDVAAPGNPPSQARRKTRGETNRPRSVQSVRRDGSAR